MPQIGWTTLREHKFLDGLGSWGGEEWPRMHKRKELLIAYLRASHRRDDWCGIDKAEITERVARELGYW